MSVESVYTSTTLSDALITYCGGTVFLGCCEQEGFWEFFNVVDPSQHCKGIIKVPSEKFTHFQCSHPSACILQIHCIAVCKNTATLYT